MEYEYLILDIETVSGEESFDKLDAEGQALWRLMAEKKLGYENVTEDELLDSYREKAALYPEFGKIVCISVGFFSGPDVRVKSFTGTEKEILEGFFGLVDKKFPNAKYVGHGISFFDGPYICKRSVAIGVQIPVCFNPAGKKPWETRFVDTADLWKFAGSKDYSSLRQMCWCLGVESPKTDIDGSQVGEVYYGSGDMPRIAAYCERDVVATATCFRKIVNP